jgi:CheY-like chemotaxis protein
MDLHVEPCDLRTIVGDAVEMTRTLYEERGCVLAVHLPDAVRLECDAHRITQVLSNLLGNAARYSRPGGHVSLAVRVEGNTVVITCDDDGMGLDAELLERLFDPFVQGARSIDRQEGGLGLGLAVSRSLVERHGGTISATSEGEGRGSHFEVRLPLRSDQCGVPANPPPPELRRIPARVLVVEDNADVREMLILALTMSGIDARGTASAHAAIEEVQRWRPDAAILDVGLPDLDGFQLARSLRQQEGGERLVLVALTGYGGEGYAAAARDSGFDAFFIKPVEVETLVDTISRLRNKPDGDAPSAQ